MRSFLVSRCQMNCVRSGLSNIWTPDRDLMDINLVNAEACIRFNFSVL